MPSKARQTIPLVLVGALFVFCAGVWSATYAQAPQGKGYLTVAVLDVGQGDSIYIESPSGVQILVDSGVGNAVLERLPEVMLALDRSLDAIVATHPDQDHIGGFVDILERYDIGAYMYPGIFKNTMTAKALEREVDEKEIKRIVARRGTVLDLGGGAVLRVLYPDRDVSNISSDKANEGGIVMELVYGHSEMLLMADVGMGVENQLLALNVEEIDSDILKVGHHGSRFSSAESFMRAVSPDVAVISVGKNSYGHPTAQTLGVLERSGAEILRTDEKGTITCRSDGAEFVCD